MLEEKELPPEAGFKQLIGAELGFYGLIGPHYVRIMDGVPVMGFRVGRRHLNPSGVCHGGALAAFADYQAVAVRHMAALNAHMTPTITLSIDFIVPVQLGEWVELHSRLLRRTGTMLFSDGDMVVGGVTVARVDAIFKIGRARPEFDQNMPADHISAL
jgi:uncharacterized protein (TIGR00369 family)